MHRIKKKVEEDRWTTGFSATLSRPRLSIRGCARLTNNCRKEVGVRPCRSNDSRLARLRLVISWRFSFPRLSNPWIRSRRGGFYPFSGLLFRLVTRRNSPVARLWPTTPPDSAKRNRPRVSRNQVSRKTTMPGPTKATWETFRPGSPEGLTCSARPRRYPAFERRRGRQVSWLVSFPSALSIRQRSVDREIIARSRNSRPSNFAPGSIGNLLLSPGREDDGDILYSVPFTTREPG